MYDKIQKLVDELDEQPFVGVWIDCRNNTLPTKQGIEYFLADGYDQKTSEKYVNNLGYMEFYINVPDLMESDYLEIQINRPKVLLDLYKIIDKYLPNVYYDKDLSEGELEFIGPDYPKSKDLLNES